MTETDLLKLKNQVSDAKQLVAELTGQLNASMKQLKDLGCETIDDAETKLNSLDEELSNLDIKIAKKTEELEKQLQ
jgi:peptidoglycan hydrolase CwlO-like protein